MSQQSIRALPVVAIDGPAGAGKSTVTRSVAQKLGYTQVDTGALYRSVAWACREQSVDWSHGPEVGRVAREIAEPAVVRMEPGADKTRIWIRSTEVTDLIRSREASLGASEVSQNPEVRAALLAIQRELGRKGGVVLEGRDIGTVVFPDAEAKFFLTASPVVRAERRRAELLARGEAPTLEAIVAEVNERDRRDMERDVAPLVQAPNAIVVDSSRLTIEEVVACIVDRVRQLERR